MGYLLLFQEYLWRYVQIILISHQSYLNLFFQSHRHKSHHCRHHRRHDGGGRPQRRARLRLGVHRRQTLLRHTQGRTQLIYDVCNNFWISVTQSPGTLREGFILFSAFYGFPLSTSTKFSGFLDPSLCLYFQYGLSAKLADFLTPLAADVLNG